jgi:hypothetical protein
MLDAKPEDEAQAEAPQIEMPKYQCHKQVWALKIAEVDGAKLTFADERFAPLFVDPKTFSRYNPVPGDYYVVYDDGYTSVSPAKAFEEGYSLLA